MTIIYLERTEQVAEGQEADFARIFYNPATEAQDLADLEALIPSGRSVKHCCGHDEEKVCTVEIV